MAKSTFTSVELEHTASELERLYSLFSQHHRLQQFDKGLHYAEEIAEFAPVLINALTALEEAWALIKDVWERRATVEEQGLGYQVWLDSELCERFRHTLRADKLYGSLWGSEVYHDVEAKHGRLHTWEKRDYYETACGGVFFFGNQEVGSTSPVGKRLCQRCAKRRASEER